MREVEIAKQEDMTPEFKLQLDALRAEARQKYGEEFYNILDLALGLDEMNETLAVAYGNGPNFPEVANLSISVITNTLNTLTKQYNQLHGTTYDHNDINWYMEAQQKLKQEFIASLAMPRTPGSHYIN